MLNNTWLERWCVSFFLVALLAVSAMPCHGEPVYGQDSSDIGTFQTPQGNWSFWIGWDATFSETYDPTNETYSWIVVFAPEAVYAALSSGKGVYSAINVNAGLDYFYGALEVAGTDRLTTSYFGGGLDAVTISRNLFGVSSGVVGMGPFSNLSFSISSGITFLRDKTDKKLQRGIQRSTGLSLAVDLVSLPLPLSVSIGTERDANDPPELGKFYGFYPVLIWDLPEKTNGNPLELIAAQLRKDAAGSGSYPMPELSRVTAQALLQAITLMLGEGDLAEFIESSGKDSVLDQVIESAQRWLDSGNTSHLNLPEVLEPPDPAGLSSMRPLLAATQIAFETAYTRPVQSHTLYADCVDTVRCRPGTTCTVKVNGKELRGMIAGVSIEDDDLEGVWIGVDTSPESYITHDRFQWMQMKNGVAEYSFIKNTETPIILGVSVNRNDLPQNIRDIQDKNLELCRRRVTFSSFPWAMFMPAIGQSDHQ